MKPIVKRCLGLLIVLCMIISIAACGQKAETQDNASTAAAETKAAEEATATKSEPVTLTFAMPAGWTGYWDIKSLVDQWMKKTGNTIEIQGIKDDQYRTVVVSKLAAGEYYDMFASDGGGTSLDKFNPKDNAVDLTNEPWVSRIDKMLVDNIFSSNGKVVMVPAGGMQPVGIVYNKKVFKDLGLSVPKTIQEFDAVCEAIKAKGIIPFYWAGKDGWTMLQHRSTIVGGILATNGGIMDKLNKNETKWTDIPGFVDAFKVIVDWNKKGYFNTDIASATYEMQNKAIVEGKAAMTFQGDWVWAEYQKLNVKPEDVGMMGYPAADGSGSYVDLATPGGYMIHPNSKAVDACKDFFNFFCTPESLKAEFAKNPGLPLFPETEVTLNPISQDVKDNNISSKSYGPHIDTIYMPPLSYDDQVKSYAELLYNKITPEQFAAQWQEAYEKTAKQAKIPGF